MARLPGYENERSISTGSEFMRARSVQDRTGAAAASLGSTIASIGSQLAGVDARLEAKAKADAERTSKLEAEAEVIRFDIEARLELQRHKDNVSESGAGFYDGYMQWYDKQWQARRDALPPERRMEAQNAFLRQRNTFATQVAGFEAGRRNEFTQKVAGEKLTSLTAGVKSGEMPYEYARQEADRFTASLGLPENQTKLVRRALGVAVETAHAERLIATNPDGALRELRKYSPEAPRSTNPHVQTNIEAAQRHNIPLNIMLPIVKGESNFDPNADMSKKINPATGKPYSTAYGYGQLLDSNWKEVGLSKSADPAIQAEALARLLTKRIAVLQSNNIEVNASNVWGAHFVGPGTFVRLMQADPNTPLRDVMLPLYGESKYRQATTGNGSLLQDGATVGQTLARIRGHIAKAEGATREYTTGPQLPPDTVVELGGTKMEFLTGADVSRLTAKAAEATRAVRDQEMQGWLKQRDADGDFNSFVRGDRTAMEKFAQSSGIGPAMNAGDPNAWGAASAFLQQHQHLPPRYAAEAQAAITSPDPTRRALGYDLLARVEATQPLVGLQQSQVAPEIKKRVERYVALQAELGFNAETARSMVEREFSPEFRDATKRDEKRIKDVVDRQSASAFEGFFDELNGWVPGLRSADYGTDRNRGRMLAQFQDRVRFHVTDGATESTAIALAKKELRQSYGPTQLFGRKQMTQWPPEMILPKGEDGTHKWVAKQVVDHVNAQLAIGEMDAKERGQLNAYKGFRVKESDLVLIGTPETARTARLGQPVKYEVWFRDNRGVLQAVPGGIEIDAGKYKDEAIRTRREGQTLGTGDRLRGLRSQQDAEEANMFAPSPAGAALYSSR